MSPSGPSQEQQILQEPYSPNLSVSMQQINNNEIQSRENNNNNSLGDIFENKHNESLQQQIQQQQQQINSPKTPTNNNFAQQSEPHVFTFTAFRNDGVPQRSSPQNMQGGGGGGVGGGLKVNNNSNLVQTSQSNLHDYNLRKLSYKNSEMLTVDSNDNFSMSLKQEPETGF